MRFFLRSLLVTHYSNLIWRDRETGNNDLWLTNGGFLFSEADLPQRPSQKWEAMG